MQDYGGPVGFRLFTQRPDRVKGFIIQNANAYIEGVGEAPKKALLPLWENRNAETEKAARAFVSGEGIRFHWTVGAKDPEAINPDNWVLDQVWLDRPGTQDYQVDLLENYKTNIALYPEWQAAFRKHQPKTLIIWGKHDPFFIPPGARAYLNDLPEAKLVWLDSGHFVLDENGAAGRLRNQGALRAGLEVGLHGGLSLTILTSNLRGLEVAVAASRSLLVDA